MVPSRKLILQTPAFSSSSSFILPSFTCNLPLLWHLCTSRVSMPPRSVCLNVFTTSLGNGKEAVESVRDMAADKSAFGDDKVVQSQQNVRRDSTQTSPNGKTRYFFTPVSTLHGGACRGIAFDGSLLLTLAPPPGSIVAPTPDCHP